MAARWLGTGLVILVVASVATSMAGRLGAATAIAIAVAFLAWNHVLLPRAAHRAFARGAFATARRRYRWLRATALTRRGAARASLSVLGCRLATADASVALATLESEAERFADVDGRAVVLNNRAYATLRGPGGASRAAAALAWAEEASRLRPDVPAIAHTRALALRTLGRADQAIALLEGLWSDGGLPPRLEAERCWELAEAWRAKGQDAYATDYRARAEQLAATAGTTPAWRARG